ncbi:MAG: hypothetical protein AAGE01_25495 [Pseudomonadota bacterium]
MTDDYTRDGLLRFLKEAAMAGHINPATARSRRTAAEQLLTQLTDDEACDLRGLDVDDLCSRFHKLQGSSIRPEAVTVYGGRLRSALQDYLAYLDRPDDFVSVGGENRQLRKRSDHTVRTEEERALEDIKLGVTGQRTDILPVPIRPDHVIYVQNLPLDLTADEADRICGVIRALGKPPESEA